MAGVAKFEDLVAWQKARELTRQVYVMTRLDAFSRDYGLRDQIRRASVSIMSNIAEGFERLNPNEFHHFLVMAKASCAEVRSQLYVALDAGYLSEAEFKDIMNQATDVARTVNALRTSVDRQRNH